MDADEYVAVIFVFGVAAALLIVLIIATVARMQREKHRVALQKAILERMGSVKDFAEFLTTSQGERFLGSLAPGHFASQNRRILVSVRVGTVLLTIGVFLMVALHTTLFGNFGNTPPRPLLLGMLLLLAAGLGMLLSAAVSFVLARRLGMLDRHDSGSSQAPPV
jgi:hypothetical protein